MALHSVERCCALSLNVCLWLLCFIGGLHSFWNGTIFNRGNHFMIGIKVKIKKGLLY